MQDNILILLITGNFILQSTIFQYFRIFGVLANSALILVVIISLLCGRKKGVAAGFLAGILQDLFFSRAIGIHILIYISIAYLIGGLENKIFKDNIVAPLILVTVSTLGYHLFYYVIMFFLSHEIDILFILRNVFSIEVIYNVVLGVLVYKKLYKYIYSYRY